VGQHKVSQGSKSSAFPELDAIFSRCYVEAVASRKVSSGAIPHVRVGSLLWFDPIRIEAWLQKN
jgi:hypothetical protein